MLKELFQRVKSWFQPAITTEDIAEFDEAKWRDPATPKWREYAAWVWAGRPEDFRIKTLPDDTLLALTAEEYKEAAGFVPTEEQMQHITAEKGTGTWESRYMQAVEEWAEFKAGELKLEQPSEVQRMASWQRAGTPQRYTQRAYRDDLGKLLGVSTFTPEDIEELAGFKPSSAEAEWAFRDTRKISPKEQLKTWAREQVAEVIRKEEEEAGLYEELAELRTIRIRKGKDIPAALQIGGIDKLMARRREIENMLGEGVDR